MPFDSQKRSKQASIRPRDASGHFLPKDRRIKTSVKTSGGVNVLSKLFKKEEAEDDALVNLKVSNPLKKIINILQELKAKQATTVSLRFTIPLIALPVAFLIAFQLGRSQANCISNYSSRPGTLKIIPVSTNTNLIPYLPDIFNIRQKVFEEKALLVNNNETISILGNAPNLKQFENQPVIVTGNYSSCEQTISLDFSENIKRY